MAITLSGCGNGGAGHSDTVPCLLCRYFSVFLAAAANAPRLSALVATTFNRIIRCILDDGLQRLKQSRGLGYQAGVGAAFVALNQFRINTPNLAKLKRHSVCWVFGVNAVNAIIA
jgi:hypothetical protein